MTELAKEVTQSDGVSVETPTEDKSMDSATTSTKGDEEIVFLTGSVCEIKSLVEKNKAGERELIEKEKYESSLEKTPFEQYALVTKQVLNEEGKLEKKAIQINSVQLLKAFKEIVAYYPSESLDFSSQTSFDSPFTLLHHHRDELVAYKKESTDDTTREHIDLLLFFLSSEAGDKGREAEKLIASGLTSFENAWMVYKPGDLLFSSSYDQDRLYQLQQTGYHEDNCRGKYFELSCGYTSCDGSRAGTSSTSLRLFEKEEWVGKTPTKISGLSATPLKFFDMEDQDRIKNVLMARGEQYLSIKGVQNYDYNGLFLYLKTPPYDFYDERSNYDGTWLPRSATERIILDAKTFVEEMRDRKEGISSAPDEKCKRCDDGTYQSVEADPLLCPPYIYGYSLEMKEWCQYFLTNLRPVEWKVNPMEALILPDAQRRLIRSLVTSHRFPDQARDESALKGKGLIMLLHGSPGSGKTLTAELVAEQTKRPLLKLSTGELGAWGERISHELKKLLTYASIWHAIVLIDEADVFLEARRSGPEQFEQNNLVAVFLKQLEYFQGILFLTSNRVGVFDPAIRSRIHLALQYEAPDDTRRALLWKQKLDELPDELIYFNIGEAAGSLAAPAMNGREISNAVNTARTLADAENGGIIRIEDLETVVGVWQHFQSSLEQIEGSSSA